MRARLTCPCPPPRDHGNDYTNATAVEVGATAGVMDGEDDVDVFALEVVDGRVYLIDVIYESLTVSHVTFYDYDVNWEWLDRVTRGAGYPARFFWEATYSGRLYIGVVGYSEGLYTMRITELAQR